jgi:DNA-binding Lrp family transcriptional regulator
MQTMFVQVKCELGHAYDVAATLVEQDGVSEVYSTSGQYDLLAKCYLEDGKDIGRYVANQIQPAIVFLLHYRTGRVWSD